MFDLIKALLLLITMPLWLPVLIVLAVMAFIAVWVVFLVGLGVLGLAFAGITQAIVAYSAT